MATGSVRIDGAFIEEWAERYRCGAANTRWRPGPRLVEVMARYPELSVLHDMTTRWDLETHIFSTVGQNAAATGKYSFAEFVTVGHWKTSRPHVNYVRNEHQKGVFDDNVKSALRPQSLPVRERMDALLTLHGVGVAVASTLLTVWRPNEFTVIDVWALATLSHFGEEVEGVPLSCNQPWWERRYDMYLAACVGIRNRTPNVTLRDLDRALWKWGEMNAPRQ